MITLEELLEDKVRLPSPKAIALRVLEAIRKDDDSFNDLADIIRSDPALTARILRLANSAYYHRPSKVTSPAQAIGVIGTQALKNIALSFVIFDTIPQASQGSFDINRYWRRAITAAVAAENLSRQVGTPAQDLFVTALLQDFGVLALFLSLGPVYTEVFDAKRISGRELFEEEMVRLGFAHPEVGYRLLNSWNLPATICEPIRAHHTPGNGQQTTESMIIHLADRIASIYHSGQSNRRSIETQVLLHQYYGFSHQQTTELIDSIGEQAVHFIEMFSIPPGDMKPYSQIIQEANEELSRLNYSYEQLVLELTQAKRNAEQLAVELKRANDSLRDLAVRDGLTGLYNHRYFQDALANALDQVRRYRHSLAILLVDIDYFKRINDEHGHPVGDQVLQEISALLVRLARSCDIVARYGGEEFALILPETGLTGAKVLANRLRRGIEQQTIDTGDRPIRITVSIGVASTEQCGEDTTRSTLITLCDNALYAAKHNGRNRVEAADTSAGRS